VIIESYSKYGINSDEQCQRGYGGDSSLKICIHKCTLQQDVMVEFIEQKRHIKKFEQGLVWDNDRREQWEICVQPQYIKCEFVSPDQLEGATREIQRYMYGEGYDFDTYNRM